MVPIRFQPWVEVGQVDAEQAGVHREALGRLIAGGFQGGVEQLVDFGRAFMHRLQSGKFLRRNLALTAHVAPLVEDDDVARGHIAHVRDQEADQPRHLFSRIAAPCGIAAMARASTSSLSTLKSGVSVIAGAIEFTAILSRA